jgi:hypothetical protein
MSKPQKRINSGERRPMGRSLSNAAARRFRSHKRCSCAQDRLYNTILKSQNSDDAAELLGDTFVKLIEDWRFREPKQLLHLGIFDRGELDYQPLPQKAKGEVQLHR